MKHNYLIAGIVIIILAVVFGFYGMFGELSKIGALRNEISHLESNIKTERSVQDSLQIVIGDLSFKIDRADSLSEKFLQERKWWFKTAQKHEKELDRIRSIQFVGSDTLLAELILNEYRIGSDR